MAVKSYGPVEQLELIEIPEPALKTGQVLVRVRGSAVNPADSKVILKQAIAFSGIFPTAGVTDRERSAKKSRCRPIRSRKCPGLFRSIKPGRARPVR